MRIKKIIDHLENIIADEQATEMLQPAEKKALKCAVSELEKIGPQTFPNGFDSWMETHHEIVTAITTELALAKTREESKVVMVSETQGTGGLYELAQTLTDKFENLHKGEEWDGEFFDTIEDFLETEFKND